MNNFVSKCSATARFVWQYRVNAISLHEMNHSANRGACMQVCRRSYTVRDKETDVELDIDNEYIMSPKDLKTIHFMNKMLMPVYVYSRLKAVPVDLNMYVRWLNVTKKLSRLIWMEHSPMKRLRFGMNA